MSFYNPYNVYYLGFVFHLKVEMYLFKLNVILIIKNTRVIYETRNSAL